MTALSGYLSAQEAERVAGAGVQLVMGLVVAWSAGDRRCNVLGNDVPDVAYAADIVGGIAPGDAVALLRVGESHLLICKVETA